MEETSERMEFVILHISSLWAIFVVISNMLAYAYTGIVIKREV